MTVDVERREWWWAKRRPYNIALIVAAPISMALLLLVWGVFESRLPCLEITGFSLVGGFFVFAIGMALANIFYFLGPFSERIIRPRNATVFRRCIFGLGLGFSLLLIFEPPIVTLAAALTSTHCIDEFGQRIELPPR